MEARRRICKRKMEHFLIAVNDHHNKPLDLVEASIYLTQVEKLYEESNNYTKTLLDTCKDEAAEIVQFHAQRDVDNVYIDITNKLKTIQAELELLAPPKPLNPFPTVKVPPINLPTFNGNQSEWTSFKDLFNAAIDSQTQLQPAQKLQYLKTALSGKPAQLIRELQITDANYQDAWDMLDKRYNNTWDLAYNVMVKLLNLKLVKGENYEMLSNLMDSANDCLRTLKTLGIPVSDMMLIVLLTEKMDPDTKREWSKTQTGVSLPTFKMFTDFMETHIRGLRATQTTSKPPGRVGNNNNKPNNLHVHHVGEPDCRVCQQHHPHFKCPTLIAKTLRERKTTIRNLDLCYNCLKDDHKLNECLSKQTCRICKGRHHSLIHEDQRNRQQHDVQHDVQPRAQRHVQNPAQQGGTSASPATALFASTNTQVLLQTAVVDIPNRYGEDQRCRILLDGCSQGSFITENCVRRLGLRRAFSSIYVNGIGDQPVPVKGKVTTTLKSRTYSHSYDIDVYILSKITGSLPTVKCGVTSWSHVDNLKLADPHFHQPGPIDILLGAEYYGLILRDGLKNGEPNTPTAQNTIFGWVLSGRVPTSTTRLNTPLSLPSLIVPHDVKHNVQHDVQPEVQQQNELQSYHVEMDEDILRKFWEVEEPPAAKIITKEERVCEEHFKATYRRDETGRYFASVPFKDTKAKMGSSRDAALRRLLQVEKRLNRNPDLKSQYQKFMQEYEELGHMERVATLCSTISTSKLETPGLTYYFPHHAVVNESSTTTKLRVVFDGSAKTSTGLSFNDVVHVGATLQRDLYEHLLRFRFVPVALKADITKMFRQFYLNEEDRDMHRILWRDPTSKEIIDYRLKTVTYGTACAPNLSTRCLQQLGLDVKEQYPDASEAILNNMYVDDYLGGTNTEDEAINLYRNLAAAAATGQLEFRKWSTNSPEVLEAIPEELRDMSPSDFDTSTTVKTLGVQWCPATDTFNFKYNVMLKPDVTRTKRVMLSELAQTFDPLGLISPVVLRGKMLMQELWKLTLDWNDNVPTEINDWWTEYQADLQEIVHYNLPRLAATNLTDQTEIHGFSDASEKGYGVVLYVRQPHVDTKNPAEVVMVTSKTKVAPLKQISLPRLELMAAVMLSDLVTYVKDVLNLNTKTYLWTDSTITLRWIAASPRRWKTFVANRVALIQSSTLIESWRHVPGTENPADLASRGCSVKVLLNSTLWSKGPPWLHENSLPMESLLTSCLTPRSTSCLPVDADLEERPTPLLAFPCQVKHDDIFQRFSNLTRLKRVVAYLMRFKTKIKGPLTYNELRESLLVLARIVQHQHFHVELKALHHVGEVPKSSKLKMLHPYIDANGILRVSGRLQGANLLDNQKHQVILPTNTLFTEMLVTYYHRANLHSGFQLTWSTLQSEYWILGGRDKVRHQIRRCVTCKRYRQEAAQQLMGNLPPQRVNKARPFLHTGVDFAGPFTLKNPIGRVPKTYKGYICVFVCFTTKAIHLEAVSSLSADAFIATFRRFVARRGLCTDLYADHGTNFVGADRQLQQLHVSNKTLESLTTSGVTFHHIPPSAPHFGGLWEAAVKSTKFHLKRAFGEAAFTFEQFATALCQVEAVLNSRPLSPMSPMPDDLQPLTPGHFLIGEPLNAVPDRCELEIPNNLLNSFRRVQQRVQNFWKQWQRDYLNTLQLRNKWYWDQPNLKVGDLVLLKEDTSPGVWRMARVLETKHGLDGKVRVVRLKTAKGELERPVVKCIPLLSTSDKV